MGSRRPFGQWPPVPRLWPSESVAIVGAGPSVTVEQVEAFRGKARVIVVNNSWQLAPWADLLYACDGKWWDHYKPGFTGLRVTQDARAKEWAALRVPLEKEGNTPILEGMSLDPMWIRGGGNGGYQALNLSIHLAGPGRRYLIGFDMQGTHWHGRHPEGLSNPDESSMSGWRQYFEAAMPDLEVAGIEVINCTPGSALTCFPMARLEDVF